MKKKILEFIKQETVLIVACVLAMVSIFFVTPDKKYIEYIDFRTLGILFSLMALMAGFQNMGVFEEISRKLLNKMQSVRQLVIMLTLLCFFFSMIITNDVALITFVPFTFVLFDMLGEETEKKWLIPVTILQTIAANLGSMLTPIGNPQNLYLYGKSGMAFKEFICLILPYVSLSFLMLLISSFIIGTIGNKKISVNLTQNNNKKIIYKVITYIILFCICVLSVLRIISVGIAFAVTLCTIIIIDRKVLKKVDYSLLLTFVGFFIFIGNIGRLPMFSSLLEKYISGNEVVISVLASQCVSNVPTALLLSNFTSNLPALIIGTNIGGLGTLIASMASLISYKFIAQKKNISTGKYVFYFSVVNIIFLVVLMLMYVIIN
ncbi:MAG: SLC13 family permease [Acutalibacteraceae bacterium]|nr:SLC13 family permease [Acutalibacteraceae bacterium]